MDNHTTCLVVFSYRSGSMGTSLFMILVNAVVFAWAIFLMLKLRKLRLRETVYFNFLMFTCFTFFFTILQNLLPASKDKTWAFIMFCLHVVVIALQWFVQLWLVFFMFEEASAFFSKSFRLHHPFFLTLCLPPC